MAMDLPVTTAQILIFLQILAYVLLIIVLYHVIFIVVRARSVLKRADRVSSQIEQVILKPISMADSLIEWLAGFLDEKRPKKHTVYDSKSQE